MTDDSVAVTPGEVNTNDARLSFGHIGGPRPSRTETNTGCTSRPQFSGHRSSPRDERDHTLTGSNFEWFGLLPSENVDDFAR